MYIDCHTHGDPTAGGGRTAARDPQAYIAACQERGIEAIVLIEPLERCLRAVERFGDFVIPVALDRHGRRRQTRGGSLPRRRVQRD